MNGIEVNIIKDDGEDLYSFTVQAVVSCRTIYEAETVLKKILNGLSN